EVHRTIDPNIVGVTVKRAIGYHSADNLSPALARDKIIAATKEALGRLSTFRPFTLPKPVRLEITFKNMINAEVLSLLPNVERVDGATIAFTGKDIVEVTKFIAFVTQYDSTQ